MQVFAILELRQEASKKALNRLIEEEESYLWREVASNLLRSVWAFAIDSAESHY